MVYHKICSEASILKVVFWLLLIMRCIKEKWLESLKPQIKYTSMGYGDEC